MLLPPPPPPRQKVRRARVYRSSAESQNAPPPHRQSRYDDATGNSREALNKRRSVAGLTSATLGQNEVGFCPFCCESACFVCRVLYLDECDVRVRQALDGQPIVA